VLGFMELYRRRHTSAGRYGALVVAGNVVLMVPYLFQSARFVAPAALVLLAYSAAGAVRLCGAVARRRRSAVE
jgi:hypothetical protein